MKSINKIVFFTIILALLLSTSMQSQTEVFVKVTDATGNFPLPYATCFLTNSKTGAITNADGVAILQNVVPKDTLIINYVGFKEVRLSNIHDTNDTIEVNLIKRAFQLDEIVVLPKKQEEISLGCPRKFKSNIVQSGRMFGFKTGILITVPDTIDKYFLSEVSLNPSYFLGVPPPANETMVRLMVYKKDKKTNLPGELLLNDNIILFPYNKIRWNDFDLKQYQILLEEKSFFVAIEWLQNQPKKNGLYGLTIEIWKSKENLAGRYVIFDPKTNRWYTSRAFSEYITDNQYDCSEDDYQLPAIQAKILPVD